MRGLTHRLQPDASPNHPRPGWTDVREYPWPNDPDLIPLLWPIVPDYSRLPLVEHLQGVIVKRPCIGEEEVHPVSGYHASMTPIVHVGPVVALASSELMNGDEVFLIGLQTVPEHFPAEHAPLRPYRLVMRIRFAHGGQEMFWHEHRGLVDFPHVGHVLASNLRHQGRGFSWGRGRRSPDTVTLTVALSV